MRRAILLTDRGSRAQVKAVSRDQRQDNMNFLIGLVVVVFIAGYLFAMRKWTHSTLIDCRPDPPVWRPRRSWVTLPKKLTSEELEHLILTRRNKRTNTQANKKTTPQELERRARAKMHPRDEQMD
jgi:hypothetical protein